MGRDVASERQRKAAWRAANRETVRAQQQRYRAANLERCRQFGRDWYHRDPEGGAAAKRAWRREHPEAVAVIRARHRAGGRGADEQARRRAAQFNQTPKWADQGAIAAVYAEADRYRNLGCEVHVDHFYPLRGRLVSGLHVHQNLRVLLAPDNAAKGNKMPECDV